MPRIHPSRASQRRAKKDFHKALDTACRVYAPAREMCLHSYESFNETAYHPTVAAKVVGLAFLSAVAAWEDFISNVYLGYLCGYPAEDGYLPRLQVGPATSKSHALLVATGEVNEKEAERRTRWANFDYVRKLSLVHFDSQNVFAKVCSADVNWLELAQTIRNRVAHNSERAKVKFKNAINQLVRQDPKTALPRGFSPGKFLIHSTATEPELRTLGHPDQHWGDVFEGYIFLWHRLSDQLSPAANDA